MFLERLDAPVLNTAFYVPNGNENDMPNCTKYCHDRAQEACEDLNLRLFKDIGIKGFPMADKWLEYSALETGQKAKTGAIACFSESGGSIHVCFVERVNSDGTCLISDSRSDPDKTLRNERFWRKIDNVVLKIGQIPGGIAGVGELLGFQYLPINDIRVSKNSANTQLTVKKSGLRCRASYGTDSAIINEGCYVPIGTYDVLETRQADGHTWCKLEDGHWVAHDASWSELNISEEKKDESDEFEEALTSFVRTVRNEHNANVAIRQGISDISAIIERLLKL